MSDSKSGNPAKIYIMVKPIFNFLCLFYWIIVEKASVPSSARPIFFHFGANCVEVFLQNWIFTSGQFVQKLHLWKRLEWASSYHHGWCSKGIGDVAPTSNFCTKPVPKMIEFNFCASWAEVVFIPDELAEMSLFDNLSGSCTVTSDQLGPK